MSEREPVVLPNSSLPVHMILYLYVQAAWTPFCQPLPYYYSHRRRRRQVYLRPGRQCGWYLLLAKMSTFTFHTIVRQDKVSRFHARKAHIQSFWRSIQGIRMRTEIFTCLVPFTPFALHWLGLLRGKSISTVLVESVLLAQSELLVINVQMIHVRR